MFSFFDFLFFRKSKSKFLISENSSIYGIWKTWNKNAEVTTQSRIGTRPGTTVVRSVLEHIVRATSQLVKHFQIPNLPYCIDIIAFWLALLLWLRRSPQNGMRGTPCSYRDGKLAVLFIFPRTKAFWDLKFTDFLCFLFFLERKIKIQGISPGPFPVAMGAGDRRFPTTADL